MARSSVFDPVSNFQFRVDVDGFDGTTQFYKVSAPKRNSDEVEYREGDDAPVLQKSPGLQKFDNVTMEHGLIKNTDFYDWAKECHSGSAGTAQNPNFRRELTITQLDREGNPFRKWRLFEAWVAEFRPISDLDAAGSEKTIEFMSVVYEDFVEELI